MSIWVKNLFMGSRGLPIRIINPSHADSRLVMSPLRVSLRVRFISAAFPKESLYTPVCMVSTWPWALAVKNALIALPWFFPNTSLRIASCWFSPRFLLFMAESIIFIISGSSTILPSFVWNILGSRPIPKSMSRAFFGRFESLIVVEAKAFPASLPL